MIRQLRNAQIIISMIGKQRAMRTFVTVQDMTFGTLPLIFEQFLASRFLFGQLIISFFIRIILGCKGIDFLGCLISGQCVRNMGKQRIGMFCLSIYLHYPVIIRSPLHFLRHHLFVPISHFHRIQERNACLILQGGRTTVPEQTSHVVFVIIVIMQFGHKGRIAH